MSLWLFSSESLDGQVFFYMYLNKATLVGELVKLHFNHYLVGFSNCVVPSSPQIIIFATLTKWRILASACIH